jgi:hypothetical protein
MSLRYDTEQILSSALGMTDGYADDVELWLSEEGLKTKWYVRATIFSVKHQIKGEIKEESFFKNLNGVCDLIEDVANNIQEAIKQESLKH